MMFLSSIITLKTRQNGHLFCRRHFQTYFSEWKLLIFKCNFIEICSQCYDWQLVSIDCGNEWVPNKWQAIASTNDDTFNNAYVYLYARVTPHQWINDMLIKICWKVVIQHFFKCIWLVSELVPTPFYAISNDYNDGITEKVNVYFLWS